MKNWKPFILTKKRTHFMAKNHFMANKPITIKQLTSFCAIRKFSISIRNSLFWTYKSNTSSKNLNILHPPYLLGCVIFVSVIPYPSHSESVGLLIFTFGNVMEWVENRISRVEPPEFPNSRTFWLKFHFISLQTPAIDDIAIRLKISWRLKLAEQYWKMRSERIHSWCNWIYSRGRKPIFFWRMD